MNILYISSYPPEKGGVSTYTQSLINSLLPFLDKNDKIYVICLKHDLKNDPPTPTSSGKEVSIIRISACTPLDFTVSLIKAVLQTKPDIIHIQYPLMQSLQNRLKHTGPLSEPLLFLLLMLKLIWKVPSVVTMHDVWSLSDAKADIIRYIRFRLLAEVLVWYFLMFSVIFLRVTRKVVTLTTYARNVLINQYMVPENKIEVIPHGITVMNSLDETYAKSKLNINAEHVILSFGYIWPGKGLEYIIRAVPLINNSVKNVRLVIAGPLNPVDGSQYLRQLLYTIKDLGIEELVTIRSSYIPEDEIAFYFSAASIIVLPYITGVGSSGVLHIAFGFKKPVVATDVGPRREELGYGLRGHMVAPKSADDLAIAICKILKETELKEQMIKNVEIYVQENSWGAIAKRTFDVYERELSKS